MADILDKVVVSIKEEPLDEDDYNCMLKTQTLNEGQLPNFQTKHFFTTLPPPQIKPETAKNEYNNYDDDDDDDDDDDEHRLQIVDEQADVITVNVSNFKRDDEREFIEKLQFTAHSITCEKCQLIFYTDDEYQRHLTSDLCTEAPKIFPCAKFCGRYFKNSELCKKHEEQAHGLTSANSVNKKFKQFHNQTPPISNVRYKLKSQYLKKPQHLYLSNETPIENIVTCIKEEPLSPPPTEIETVPFDVNVEIKEEDNSLPLEFEIKSEPIDYADKLTPIKAEAIEILPPNWPKSVNIQLPANLKVISMPLSSVNKLDNTKFKTISLPQNSAFKPTANGLLQIQALPKNVKIVKIANPKNNLITSQKNPIPINQSVKVKMENLMQYNNLQVRNITPTKLVLKPANLNINTTYKLKKTVGSAATTTTTTTPPGAETETAKKTKELKPERVRKIQVESKDKLRLIEQEPQKRKLIDEMLQQIKTAEEGMTFGTSLVSNSSCSEYSQDSMDTSTFSNKEINSTTIPSTGGEQSINKIPINSPNPQITQVETETKVKVETEDVDIPRSFFLPINTTFDAEVIEYEKKYASYQFNWVCPQCPRLYEMKRAVRNHLILRHNVPNDEVDKLQIEFRPYLGGEKAKSKNSKKGAIKTEIITDDNVNGGNGNAAEKSADSEGDGGNGGKRRKKNYECVRCGRNFSSSGVLKDHLRANCSRDPQYPCLHCTKRFYSASTLNCHLTIHTGELPHKCNFCEKRFRTRGQVTVHHRTHTGERPFVCQVCSQAFTHRETLIAHLSRHIGMKRYKCYGCNKHFSCISGLKTHRDKRPDTCGQVKFNPRAVGPRVRVIRGNVMFEPQPEINPYLRTEDPPEVLSEIQNQPQEV